MKILLIAICLITAIACRNERLQRSYNRNVRVYLDTAMQVKLQTGISWDSVTDYGKIWIAKHDSFLRVHHNFSPFINPKYK